MRQKKKRAAKPRKEMTEEELLQVQARALAEGTSMPEGSELDMSVYSYYSVATDLTASQQVDGMSQQPGSQQASPDKRDRISSATNLGESGEKVIDVQLKSSDNLQQPAASGDVKILAELEPVKPEQTKMVEFLDTDRDEEPAKPSQPTETSTKEANPSDV